MKRNIKQLGLNPLPLNQEASNLTMMLKWIRYYSSLLIGGAMSRDAIVH